MEKTVHSKLIILLVILNFCMTCVLGYFVYQISQTHCRNTTEQYVMYVGTNDKDTYSQLVTTEEAKAIIDQICFKYIDGYTIQDATGAWVDEKGSSTHENTIVCYFDGADKKVVYQIADEVLKALNQNTVLIEKNSIQMDFYAGEEGK